MKHTFVGQFGKYISSGSVWDHLRNIYPLVQCGTIWEIYILWSSLGLFEKYISSCPVWDYLRNIYPLVQSRTIWEIYIIYPSLGPFEKCISSGPIYDNLRNNVYCWGLKTLCIYKSYDCWGLRIVCVFAGGVWTSMGNSIWLPKSKELFNPEELHRRVCETCLVSHLTKPTPCHWLWM